MEISKKTLAHATPNGIRFWSKKDDNLSVQECVDNEGNLSTVVYYGKDIPSVSFLETGGLADLERIIHIVIFICGSVLVGCYLPSCDYRVSIKFYLWFHLLWAAYCFSDFIASFVVLNFTPKGRASKRFHAAEHKTWNAYRKNQDYPTYEQIKNASKYSVYCGSRDDAISTLKRILEAFTIAKFGAFLPIWGVVPLVVASKWLVSRVCYNYNIDMIFQGLYISEPTERELNCAYEGLKNLKKAEEGDMEFYVARSENDVIDYLFMMNVKKASSST